MKNQTFLYVICAIIGSLYCAGLTYTSTIGQNVFTILFVIFLIGIFFINLRKNSGLKQIILQLIFINLSIAITAFVLKSPDSFFWVQDSLLTHLPESLKFTQFIKGHFAPVIDLGIRQGKTTHALTGAAIAVLGINTFATIFVQLIFKIIIVVCIYNISIILWNKKVSLIAIQLYGFCPTIFFYNLVLYKEGAVQTMIAAIVLFSLKVFWEKKYLFMIPLIAILYLLVGERVYLTFIMLTMFPFLIFNLPFIKSKSNIAIYLLSACGVATACYFYRPDQFNFVKIVREITELRKFYASFSDIRSQYNYDIPYPLAFLKIIFSPYFTFQKFRIFSDFSNLLTWGSFINQFIILTSILGFFRAVKEKIFHLYLWIPFIIFLLFAAYISPWSGRIRDSFYPLIACYAAYYLNENKYFIKFFGASRLTQGEKIKK